MRGVNKVILVGTLGKDPETKTFPNGGSITQFSIATSDSWTDKNTGERKEQTEWHRIVLNNRIGEIAQQYLRKGSKVYIEGSLRTRQWTDQNGQERYTTEIRGDQMQMLDSAKTRTKMPSKAVMVSKAVATATQRLKAIKVATMPLRNKAVMATHLNSNKRQNHSLLLPQRIWMTTYRSSPFAINKTFKSLTRVGLFLWVILF